MHSTCGSVLVSGYLADKCLVSHFNYVAGNSEANQHSVTAAESVKHNKMNPNAKLGDEPLGAHCCC